MQIVIHNDIIFQFLSSALFFITLVDLVKLYIVSTPDETIPEYKAVVMSGFIKGTTFVSIIKSY